MYIYCCKTFRNLGQNTDTFWPKNGGGAKKLPDKYNLEDGAFVWVSSLRLCCLTVRGGDLRNVYPVIIHKLLFFAEEKIMI